MLPPRIVALPIVTIASLTSLLKKPSPALSPPRSAATIVMAPSVPTPLGFARSCEPLSIVMDRPWSSIAPAFVVAPLLIVRPLRLIVSATILMFWPLVKISPPRLSAPYSSHAVSEDAAGTQVIHDRSACVSVLIPATRATLVPAPGLTVTLLPEARLPASTMNVSSREPPLSVSAPPPVRSVTPPSV